MKTTQTKEELQKQVNFWRDKYQADEAYEEYQNEQIKFNSKHY